MRPPLRLLLNATCVGRTTYGTCPSYIAAPATTSVAGNARQRAWEGWRRGGSGLTVKTISRWASRAYRLCWQQPNGCPTTQKAYRYSVGSVGDSAAAGPRGTAWFPPPWWLGYSPVSRKPEAVPSHATTTAEAEPNSSASQWRSDVAGDSRWHCASTSSTDSRGCLTCRGRQSPLHTYTNVTPVM